ncbi:type IV secretory system conjugative DNA transfer family protein [Pseudonocardia dioxanivorans]|uniref:type IV secretory system conjugative DNA transfer family protein n=1 Tax=Pseudonocardia dioxanivorans TaxID=240495 RepID=UPI000CD208F7|nr:TraM recognition domain-containing protein [Pseudonocardia dioxanivorans]
MTTSVKPHTAPTTSSWRRRGRTLVLVLAAATGAKLSLTPGDRGWLITATVTAVAAAVAAAAVLVARNRPGARLRRHLGADGWAGWLDRHEYRTIAGPRAVRRLTGTPAGSAPHHSGQRLGRLVSGPLLLRGRPVYSPHRRGMLVLGPQGSGKSSFIVNPIREFPGAAYVTSTKTELVDLTAAYRATRGPVLVFNPTGLGGLASTLRWDPVAGCDDAATADARARALVRGGGGAKGTQNADFWADRAAEILRCYLLAAALTGQGMAQVMAWTLHPDDRTPSGILDQHGAAVPPGWLGTLDSHLAAAANTRTGYFAALTPAVAFMDSPTVASGCRPAPGPGGGHVDLTRFLRETGTIYVVAGDDARVAPLLTALTEAVFATAKQVAATSPNGYLNPGLGLYLDEVAHTTPVPLDVWAADSRGWGITVNAMVQDLAQLETRWGATRAQTIFANLPTRVVLPGVANRDDLETLAYLGGQRRVARSSHGRTDNGSGQTSRSHNQSWATEQVIAGHTIHGLPRWHAYVLGLGTKPAIVRFTPGWRRRRGTPSSRIPAPASGAHPQHRDQHTGDAAAHSTTPQPGAVQDAA